jgi:hypothetical protein
MKRILVLAANPKNTPPLRLGEEVRDIEEALQRSKHRDEFEFRSKWAVQPRAVRRAILDYKPHIIHFSGHGVGRVSARKTSRSRATLPGLRQGQ